jgi:hypothetical protein
MPYYLSRQRPAVSERLSIEADLRENTVRDLVAVSVLQWRESAMLGARKLLGFERYKRSGKKRQNRRKNKARGAKTSMEIDAVEPSAEDCSEIQVESELDAENPMEVDEPGKGGGVDEDGSVQKWHSVPGKLDPEMRVTSWFACTRCINMDPGYKRMRVLDFRGVCTHECWQKDWSKAQRKAWNIGMRHLSNLICGCFSRRMLMTVTRTLRPCSQGNWNRGEDAGNPGIGCRRSEDNHPVIERLVELQ